MRRVSLLLLPLLLAMALLSGVWRGLTPAGAAGRAELAPEPELAAFSAPITDRLLFRSHVGGAAGSVAVEGELAVATYGSVAATLDLNGGGDMPRLGSLPLEAEGAAAALDGAVAYVGTAGAGLAVLDVSDPARPREMAALPEPETIHDLDVQPAALLSAGDDGLYLLDVADPAQPVALSTTLNGVEVRSVVGAGGRAYAVTAGGVLAIVDVSAPLTPTVAGEVAVGPAGGGVGVVGTRAYVSWSDCTGAVCTAHVSVVNVAAAGNPQVVTSRLLGQGRAGSVAVSGGYAYVTRSTAGGVHQGPGIDILDVSTPDFPVPVQSIDVPGAYGAADLVVQGTSALVAYQGAGVRRFNVSDPTAPLPNGSAAGPAAARAVEAWSGGWLVGAGDGVTRGELWRVTVDGESTLLAAATGMQFVSDIGMDGALGVLAGPSDGSGRLRVMDLTTPTAPLLQGIWNGDVSGGVAVAGNTVIAAGADVLRFIDVTAPLTPTQVGSYAPTGGIAAQGTLLAVAAGSQGLHLVDIADAAAPQVVGIFDPAWPVENVALDGALAIVAAGSQGLYVVDISHPAQPVLLGELDPLWPVPALRAYNGFALVPAGTEGVRVVDLSDPTAPQPAGQYVDGRSFELGAGWGDRVLLGAEEDGLFLLTQQYAAAGRVAQANGLPWAEALLTAGPGVVAGSHEDGTYRFRELFSGTYTVTAAVPGYVFTPTLREVTVPPNQSGLDFFILPPPRVYTVGVAGAELVFTDTQGMPTTLSVPAEAVSTPLTVAITPTVVGDAGGYRFAGHGFDVGPAVLRFNRPVTVTIDFTPADVSGKIEEDLVLWRRGSGQWEPAGATCDPALPGLVAAGSYQVAICAGGRFALFAPPRLWFLPVLFN